MNDINEAEAAMVVREKLAERLGELMELAIKLALGIEKKRFYPEGHPKCGQEYAEIVYDSETLRFLLERVIPPARTEMDLNSLEGLIQAFGRENVGNA